MSLKLRMARSGAKKRPFYNMVVTDSRNRRDGRFVERIGYYNPVAAANEKTDRLKLDLDKAKDWINKGAKPSDRIMRFLDAAAIWSLDTHDIRNAATDKHRTVDDTPAGGGPGMVMKADVLARALDAVPPDTRPRLLMSPRGRPLTQSRVAELARGMGVVIVCARFEGVDERLIAARGLEEVSLGDFVLSGGEIAALALLDACVRLLPGVMGKEASAAKKASPTACSNTRNTRRPQVFEG